MNVAKRGFLASLTTSGNYKMCVTSTEASASKTSALEVYTWQSRFEFKCALLFNLEIMLPLLLVNKTLAIRKRFKKTPYLTK